MSEKKDRKQKMDKETKNNEKEAKSEKRPQDKESKEEKIAELTNMLQRLQADFENYKRRTDAERANQLAYGNAELVKKLLPLIDNFELALKNKDRKEDFIKGMELIYSQFLDTLKDEGLEKIKTEDMAFNPNMHEAMMTEESDKEPNMIIEEFQAGYKIKDKVIRHSKVKVSK